MVDPRTPVLVGCGQLVQKVKDPEQAKSPMQLMAEAAALSAADCGLGEKLWPAVDTVATVRFITDSPDANNFPFGVYPNAPQTLANMVGASNTRATIYGPTGGNTPQYIVNNMAERIAKGESDVVLIGGSECFASLMRALGQGLALDWHDDPGGSRIELGNERLGVSDVEKRHKLHFPVNAYPLFENALRGAAGRTVAEQQQVIGELFAPFTVVAEGHPQAWFPQRRSVEEIATPGPDNRYIGFPYTKFMNAIMQVDQAAGVVMMSSSKADELGVPADRRVYLHGCADANDIWCITDRVNLHSSPAIRLMGRKAFDMAGWTVDEIDWFDLYSCFPSAVQIGRDELGIAADDPRPLTVTGGLPYFGGAGNDYVLHSIATMMDKVRARPGAKGVCTANGWYVTKHSIGLYSTEPPMRPFEREDPSAYQHEIDSEPHPEAVETPSGAAKVETYTVVHDRNGPQFGIVIGRLDECDRRFVAHVPSEPAILDDMVTKEQLGRPGTVAQKDGLNIFTFA